MISELINVIRTTRLNHLLGALVSPSHAIEAFKYHYRRVGEGEFVDFFSRRLGCGEEEVRTVYRDFAVREKVWEKMKTDLASTPGSYGAQMLQDGPSLYLLTRLLKPESVVETGVAAGVSSGFILQAMQDNNKGRLYSIEFEPTVAPSGKQAGWLVPENLRPRWELFIGDSKLVLPPLLNRLGRIDCFMHDSLHTYDHMYWELSAAWEHLNPKNLLLAHDVGDNRAFFDFMKEKGVSWRNYRVHGLLGGLQAEISGNR